MIIDKEGKVLNRWNIIDVFFILLVIGVIGGFGLNLMKLQGKMSDQDRLKAEIRARGEVKKEVLSEIEEEAGKKRNELNIWLDGYRSGYMAGYSARR